MKRQYKVLIFLTISFLIIFSGCSYGIDDSKDINERQTKEYSNPIDEYYLPLIDNPECEADRRTYQDTYKGVWKSEFDNIMSWMYEKCVYQEDKDRLNAYEESVRQLCEATYYVIVTDCMGNYSLPTDSPDRKNWGNGTRSGLSQIQAEIYRDAGMRLIDSKYKFLDIDYSKQHYE